MKHNPNKKTTYKRGNVQIDTNLLKQVKGGIFSDTKIKDILHLWDTDQIGYCTLRQMLRDEGYSQEVVNKVSLYALEN